MSDKTLVSQRRLKFPLALASTLALVACGEDGQFAFPSLNRTAADETGVVAAQSVQLVERDIEAPDAFQVTESGLWDGRPSLGGVWVAHPDVTEPERVIIRNQDNGTFVIGALFRRERNNPGPALQVSSDAASALEMLAGAPSQLQVTALRREEVAETPEAQPTATFEAPADISSAPIESTPLSSSGASDPIAGAAAAIDAAEAAAPAASSLAKPFVQLGIFSVEANAAGTADRMRAAGIVPTVLEQDSQGSTSYRVIVGPASSEAQQAELLRKVQAQGFEDALFVSN